MSLRSFPAGTYNGNTVTWEGEWHDVGTSFDRGSLDVNQPKTQGLRKNATEHLPRIHRAFSNLKNWLAGTHHGVSAKHLPGYVDEFVFRFNRRRTPMAAFQSLLGLTSRHKPTTYKMLYGAESTG